MSWPDRVKARHPSAMPGAIPMTRATRANITIPRCPAQRALDDVRVGGYEFSIGHQPAFAPNSVASPIGSHAMPLTNLQTRAVETLVHPYTNQATFRDTGPLVLRRGQGGGGTSTNRGGGD